MKPSRDPLGHLELDVLRYVTDHHPISVRDVAAHFATTSGQARTTVLTVMERLRAKGHLSRRKVAGRHHYAPTVAKAELLNRMVGDFVDEVLGGEVSPFVAYLSQSPLLSPEEVKKLEQLLRRIESREKKDES
jgi:BlaI family transcriptional regulator, penicillinase repressor